MAVYIVILVPWNVDHKKETFGLDPERSVIQALFSKYVECSAADANLPLVDWEERLFQDKYKLGQLIMINPAL